MIVAGLYGSDVGRVPRPGDGPWSWLVTMRYGGRVLRWSNHDSNEVELDGALYSTSAHTDLSGLSITDEIAIGATGTAPRSASFVVYMPDGVDVARLERQGVKLAGSEVEVALLPEGGTASDRFVLLRGYVSEPTYGTADDPVSFTAREPEQQGDAQYPPRNASVTSALLYDPGAGAFIEDDLTRSEEAKLEAIGKAWPRVFGHPGKLELIGSNGVPTFITVPGSPAYVVSQAYDGAAKTTEWLTLLLSYEHVIDTSDPINLCRHDDEADRGLMTVSIDVYNGVDYRGADFTYTDDAAALAVPDPSLPDPLVAGEQERLIQYLDWYTSWAYRDAPPINGTTTPSAGDMLLWMVERSSLLWDVGRCQTAAAALSAYELSGAIEDWVAPLDWLTDHVFGKLPVYLTSGPLGLYPVVVPYLRQFAPTIASLTVDDATCVLPPQSVQVERDGDTTEVTVRWARDAQTGGFYKAATRVGLTSEPRTAGAIGPVPVAGYGPVDTGDSKPRATTIDLPYVWNDQTAYRILDWLTWREMKQRRTVGVQIDPSRFGHVMVGDVVAFTADDLHLDAAPCLVTSITRSAGPWWRVKVMPLDE